MDSTIPTNHTVLRDLIENYLMNPGAFSLRRISRELNEKLGKLGASVFNAMYHDSKRTSQYLCRTTGISSNFKGKFTKA